MLVKVSDIVIVMVNDSCFLSIKLNPMLTVQVLKSVTDVRAGNLPNTAATVNEGTNGFLLAPKSFTEGEKMMRLSQRNSLYLVRNKLSEFKALVVQVVEEH